MTTIQYRESRKGGAPRWIITFADLMALLFALFVLLLSFSDINSDSFKRNAGPISEAFNTKNVLQLVPTPSKPESQSINLEPQLSESIKQKKYRFMSRLRQDMAVEITNSQVEILEKGRSIVVRFPDKSAFPSGSKDLVKSILPTLDKLSRILSEVDGQIIVSGYTDNAPISTSAFRSNWDLSTARAVSVVHYILKSANIEPSRITAQGFADSRPLAPNDSPENRATNRRVEISIEMTDN